MFDRPFTGCCPSCGAQPSSPCGGEGWRAGAGGSRSSPRSSGASPSDWRPRQERSRSRATDAQRSRSPAPEAPLTRPPVAPCGPCGEVLVVVSGDLNQRAFRSTARPRRTRRTAGRGSLRFRQPVLLATAATGTRPGMRQPRRRANRAPAASIRLAPGLQAPGNRRGFGRSGSRRPGAVGRGSLPTQSQGPGRIPAAGAGRSKRSAAVASGCGRSASSPARPTRMEPSGWSTAHWLRQPSHAAEAPPRGAREKGFGYRPSGVAPTSSPHAASPWPSRRPGPWPTDASSESRSSDPPAS